MERQYFYIIVVNKGFPNNIIEYCNGDEVVLCCDVAVATRLSTPEEAFDFAESIGLEIGSYSVQVQYD